MKEKRLVTSDIFLSSEYVISSDGAAIATEKNDVEKQKHRLQS